MFILKFQLYWLWSHAVKNHNIQFEMLKQIMLAYKLMKNETIEPSTCFVLTFYEYKHYKRSIKKLIHSVNYFCIYSLYNKIDHILRACEIIKLKQIEEMFYNLENIYHE